MLRACALRLNACRSCGVTKHGWPLTYQPPLAGNRPAKPLKVKCIGIPFVFVKQPNKNVKTLDVGCYHLARIESKYVSAPLHGLKKPRKRKNAEKSVSERPKDQAEERAQSAK